MKQKATRGTEKTYNPGITFTKDLTKVLSGKLDYNFTFNSSKDKANYNYRKHVITTGVQATF